MFPWLLQSLSPLAERMELHAAGDSRIYLTARIALAAVTSFLAAILLGPRAINWLKTRCRERIDSASPTLNKLHAGKKDTPTMGGVFLMAAVVIASLLWADLSNDYVQLGILITLGFTLLGAWDDWIKLSTARRGLSVKQKLAVQTVLALVTAAALYGKQSLMPQGTDLVSPLGHWALPMGLWFIPWGALVIVSTSNGVNLTDGLDGLATGCSVFCGLAFVALAYLAGHHVLADYLSIPFMSGAGEIGVIVAALVGAMLGFLWFNCYPAQVFMGDAGSLPIGALLGMAALVTRQEVLLVIIGGVFVIETLSVIVQIGWYKLTGVRLIACSPLHNHFVIRGHHEIKVVTRFWIGSAVLAILGMVSLKIQ